MSSSKKTAYYNLSQFQDADKPSWRGDYNADMSKIDTGMQEIKTSAIDAKTAAQNAESSINEVKRDYIKKTDAQNTYATKTALNETKTTIENNADSKFVTKTTYDTAIAGKADKTSVYTKTESDAKYLTKTAAENIVSKLDASNILCIGDSFGDENAKDHGNWVKGLRAALPNATFMNQCVSGSGYVRDYGVKFIQQINNAINANFKPDYIIIVGGVNDTDENLTSIISAVRDVCATLQTSYPLAKVLFVPMCAGFYHLTLKRRYVAMAMQNIISNYNYAYFRYAWTLNVNRREFVIDDNLHPTETGARNISDKILQWLIDGTVYMGPTTQIMEQIINNGTARMWVTDGTFYFALQGNITDVSTATKIIALPDQFATTNTCRQVTGYMVNGTKPIAATYEIADNVQGATIKITTPLEKGQFQLNVSYDL